MKKAFLFIVLLISFTAISQKKLNSYKYAIIPSQFNFQKENNQYGLNMLLKYKFQQLGFETYLEQEDIPAFLQENRCLAVIPSIIDSSGVFMTTLVVEVKNCYGKVLFVTKEGSSRTKNYKISYNEALRSSLKSFKGYSLEFSPENNLVNTNVVEKQLEIEKLQAEVAILKNNNSSSNNINTNIESSDAHFIIKPTVGGFVLLNSVTKKIAFTIYLSKKADTYFIKGQSGVIYKNGLKWYREFIYNDKVGIEELDIRF